MTSRAAEYTIGIDVGGTFTDMFLWSSEGTSRSAKVPSTPRDPSIGVLDGLAALAQGEGLEPGVFVPRVRTIVHGTTVTTNAVLTRGGARTGLVTTAGVRDALEMRRGIREEQYDNRYLNVEPLVPRNLRIGVRGRLDAQGAELEPLSLEDVREAARALSAAGVEAVAVCFMNSFAGGAHERAAAGVIAAAMPEAYVSVSSEVLPLIRFYDRVSTTALDAYTGPVLSRYLGSLARRLAEAGFGGVLLVMQSNGGVALADVVARRPATTLLSGPAAGPRAGLAYVEPLGERSCLVADMGGTSFDASLVDDGEVALKAAGEIARLRIALPMLDIVTIGAGGGSIGWIDAGGLLRMGPQSAGADPGPACYGRGGREPTCTDADLVLGYLDPRSFAGGRLALDEDAARAAIEERIARPLSLGLEEAAAGMVRVIDANMAHGIREITVKRGVDPRALPLVVAGGAGGLHACMVAAELGIRTIVVPPVASVLCASGMLLTDLGHDVVRSKVAPLEAAMADLAALVAEMIREGGAELAREGVRERDAEHRVALDLRYLKQYHEVTVPVARAWIEEGALEPIARAFHAAHDRLYGYELAAQGTPLELINVRVRSLGRVDKPPLPRVPEGDGDPRDARNGERRAYLPRAARFAPVPVYDGHRLRAGDRFEGPALVERTDTTLLVTSDYAARVDSHGTVVLVKSATEEEA